MPRWSTASRSHRNYPGTEQLHQNQSSWQAAASHPLINLLNIQKTGWGFEQSQVLEQASSSNEEQLQLLSFLRQTNIPKQVSNMCFCILLLAGNHSLTTMQQPFMCAMLGLKNWHWGWSQATTTADTPSHTASSNNKCTHTSVLVYVNLNKDPYHNSIKMLLSYSCFLPIPGPGLQSNLGKLWLWWWQQMEPK